MNTTATTHSTDIHVNPAPLQTGRRHSLVATVAMVLAAALGLFVAGPANAYTTTQRSGVPVNPTIYQVQGSHYNAGSPVTGPMWKQWIYQSGPVVSRVAGSGSQTVGVAYKVDRWTGSAWAQVASRNGSTTIASTQVSAKAPTMSLLPTAGPGYYRVRLSLTWTSPIGAVLGSMTVSMNQSGDYVCSTSRTCTAGAGWVYVG